MNFIFTIFQIVFFAVFVTCESKTNLKKNYIVTKLTNCKGQLDDGRLLDLTSLDKQLSPRVSRKEDYDYKFNPCSPIPCVKGTLPSASVCQTAYKTDISYVLGNQDESTFEFDGKVFKITYEGGLRTSILNCKCGKKEEFTYTGELNLVYNFDFTSPCCCPDGCSGKKTSDGLSLGSVLLIIFFVLLFVYFLGGFIFLKFARKLNGTETIPNYNFWIAVPSDIKTGVSFAVSKVRGNKSSNYQNI